MTLRQGKRQLEWHSLLGEDVPHLGVSTNSLGIMGSPVKVHNQRPLKQSNLATTVLRHGERACDIKRSTEEVSIVLDTIWAALLDSLWEWLRGLQYQNALVKSTCHFEHGTYGLIFWKIVSRGKRVTAAALARRSRIVNWFPSWSHPPEDDAAAFKSQ